VYKLLMAYSNIYIYIYILILRVLASTWVDANAKLILFIYGIISVDLVDANGLLKKDFLFFIFFNIYIFNF